MNECVTIGTTSININSTRPLLICSEYQITMFMRTGTSTLHHAYVPIDTIKDAVAVVLLLLVNHVLEVRLEVKAITVTMIAALI